MADAGFFKGTSAEQDRRFADKEHRLLKSMKFPPEFDRKVDMRKVNLQVMRPWITKKVVELVGFEDEVVVEYAMGLLEDQSKPADPKLMQINLTGFLESKTPAFMSALWSLLLEAQNSPAGVPASFVQEKKEELRQKQEADDRALAEARRRGEHDLRLDEIRQRERGDRRGGGGGFRGGRGGERGGRNDPFRGGPGGDSFRGRNRDSGWGNRGGGRGGDRDPPRRRSPSRSRSRSRSPSPRRRYRRSPSPEGRRRSPSPGRRRSPPRRNRRSPSPRGNRRSVTPPRGGKRRSPSPRRRSPSPRGNRRSPSPRGSRRSPSPRRNRRRSPSRTPSAMSRSRSRSRSPSPRRDPPRRRGDSRRRDGSRRRDEPSPRRRDDSPPRRRGTRRSPTNSRSPSPARKRRRSSSRSGSDRGDEKRDSPGVSVQPLSIKGAASTGKKSRLEEGGEDEKAVNARVESELRENLLRQKVVRSLKGRKGSDAAE